MGETKTTTTNRDRLTTWVVSASMALGIAVAAMSIAWAWPTQAVANALQLLGIALTALGVAVVRSWLEIAVGKAADAKHGLARWAALRRAQLHRLWARLRKRPTVVQLHSILPAVTSDAAGRLTVRRERVDRDTISDREWLTFLDDRVAAILARLDEAAANRTADREDLERRLRAQRTELRAEIQHQTRQGWELILAGLTWSAIGAAVGALG